MVPAQHGFGALGRRAALLLLIALAAGSLGAPEAARAQDAFHCIDQLSDDEVQWRIRYIEESFRKGKRKATAWRYGWMAAFFVIGGVETFLAVDAADNDRDWNTFAFAYLAGGAYLAGLSHLIFPAPDVWGLKRIQRKPAGTEEERRAKLRYATELLSEASAVEGLLGGPIGVAGSVVFSVVGGSVKAAKWPGKSRGVTSAVFIAPPVLLGAAALTAPREAIRAYENYRGIACSSKYYDKSREEPEFDFSFSPGGASMKVSF